MASRRREHLLRDSAPPGLPHTRTRAASGSRGPSCACAQYSTGKANLPGSTRQRDLLTSFSRMVSELLRHSNRAEVCERIPEHLRLCHRPQAVTRDDAPVAPHSKAKAPPRQRATVVGDLFATDADWALGPLNPVAMMDEAEHVDEEDLLELAEF